MNDFEMIKSVLLDKETFSFSVIQNCVLLYDKTNSQKIHARALNGEENATKIMTNLQKFTDAKNTIAQTFYEKYKNDCLDSLKTCELIEEYEMGDTYVLICSKKRGNTKCFVIDQKMIEVYRSYFYIHNFDKIIKEEFLGCLKKQTIELPILTSLTHSMWSLFCEKVVLLLDYIHKC